MRARAFLSTCLLACALHVSVPAMAQTIDDLDEMDAQSLDEDLTDELDDVYTDYGIDPEEYYDNQELVDAFMEALSDAGDTGDEQDISFAELEYEMEEAGTTVEEVVAAAVDEADDMAAISTPGFSTVASRDLQLAYRGRARADVAFGSVKSRLIRTIRTR